MPAAAGAWLAVMGTSLIGASITGAAYTALYAVGYLATTLAISFGLAKVSSALAGRPKLSSGTQARRMVIRDSTHPRVVLYGEGRTGGVIVYINTSGSKNQYLDFVIAIAGREISAITDVWFDDVKIDEADINSGAAGGGEVTGGDFAGYAEIWKYLGTDTQTASSTLTSAYPTEWDSDHRGRGVAYVHIRLTRNTDVFEQGAPQQFSFGFRGAKVYDPRLDSTNGGSGAHRITDPSTWAYSQNPALIAADYLTGGSVTNSATRVSLAGFGASPDDVDWTSVAAAANVCEEQVAVPPETSPLTTQNRYLADGVLSLGEVPADNLEQILTSMLGQMTYSSGKYRLYAGAFDTPSLTLNENDLAAGIEYAAGTPRSNRYNAVKGNRWDADTGQEVEFLPRTSPAYEALDGGSTLYRDIELPFTQDEYRAQRIAQIILRRSREQQTLVWRGNMGCLRVGVWETVSVTVDELGLSSKTFRCISRDVKPDGDDWVVELTLREEFGATYTDPLLEDYDDITPVSPSPTPDDYNSFVGHSIIYDPDLEWGVDGGAFYYWTTSAGVLYQDTDVAEWTFDGISSRYMYSRPTASLSTTLYGSWGLGVSIRYRVTSALSGPDQKLTITSLSTTKALNLGAAATYFSCDFIDIDLSSCVVGTWYTKAAVMYYTSAASAGLGERDQARLLITGNYLNLSGGVVEISHINAIKVAAPANYTADTSGSVPKISSAPSGKVLLDDGTWGDPTGGWTLTAGETTYGLTSGDIDSKYPPFDVRRYGAAESASGADNSAAFQIAFDIAEAVGGATVVMGAGEVYEMASAVELGSLTNFDGRGGQLKMMVNDEPILKITKSTYNNHIAIRDVYLLWNSQQTSSHTTSYGIQLAEGSVTSWNILIENVNVKYGAGAVILPEVTGCTAFLVKCINVTADQCALWGFDILGATSGARTNIAFEGCWVLNTSGSEISTARGFRIKRTHGVSLNNSGCDHIKNTDLLFCETSQGTIGTFWAESCDITNSSGVSTYFNFSNSDFTAGLLYADANNVYLSGSGEHYAIRVQNASHLAVDSWHDYASYVPNTWFRAAYYYSAGTDSSSRMSVNDYSSSGSTPAVKLADSNVPPTITPWDSVPLQTGVVSMTMYGVSPLVGTNVVYTKSGNIVHLKFNATTGNANGSGTMDIGYIPTNLRPARYSTAPARVYNGTTSTLYWGIVEIWPSGSLVFYTNPSGTTPPFTTSGTIGIGSGMTITYSLV